MHSQPDRRAVLLFSAILLVLSLLLFRLGGYVTDSQARLADLNWSALVDAGFMPYRDFWVERPPLLTASALLADRGSLLLPPWIDVRLWRGLGHGLLPLVAGLTSLVLFSRLGSAVRLAVFGASLALISSVVAGEGTLPTSLLLGWLLLIRADRWRAAAVLAACAPFVGGALVLVVHIVGTLVCRRSRLGVFSALPVLVVGVAALLTDGPLAASVLATVAGGGSPLLTASERRLDPLLAPTPGLDWLLPFALSCTAVVLARVRRVTLLKAAALAIGAAGLVGPLSGPSTMLLLVAIALLALPLTPAALWAAGLGALGTTWLAIAPSDRAFVAGISALAGGAFLIAVLRAPANGSLDDARGTAAQLVSFLALRMGALVLMRPFGYFGEWNDFNFFLGWARMADSGLFPYRDFWMEHPPIFPVLVSLAYQIAKMLPPMPDGHVWFNLALGLLTLPAEVAALLALRRISRIAASPAGEETITWLYVLSFPALFFWTAGFDGLALAFLLLGISAALERRGGWAGLWVALGTLTKVVPATALPALLLFLGRREAVRLLLVFGGTLLIVLMPVVLVNPRLAAASASSLTTRGSWETLWALADGYFRGGELVPPAERTDPDSVGRTARPAALPWLPFAGVGATGYLVLLAITRRPLSPRRTVAWAAAGLLGLLLISKGWSPQFVVYPLGLVFLTLPLGRALLYALNLISATFYEYPIALLLLDGEPAPLAVSVVWRTAILGAIVVELLAIGMSVRPRPTLARTMALGLTVAPVSLIPLTLWALLFYRSLWLEPDDPRRQFLVEAQQAGAGVVAPSEPILQQLAPYLSGPMLRPVGGLLATNALGSRSIWLIAPSSDLSEEAEAARVLTHYAFPLGSADAGIERFLVAADNWQHVGLPFGPLALDEATARRYLGETGPIALVGTRWRAIGSPTGDLRLFVHAVDANGRLLAQDDHLPAGLPPKLWGNETVTDRAVVSLPPGTDRLLVGLYDADTGRRLTAPDGRDAMVLSLPN
ncbi:MAG: hypothetical protein U0556_08400 [Dehalococcoidia bacterium]